MKENPVSEAHKQVSDPKIVDGDQNWLTTPTRAIYLFDTGLKCLFIIIPIW